MIGGLFQYAALGAAKDHGATGSNEAFAILRERTTVSRFEALRSIKTGFIGREEELELLLRRWNSAKSADGRVVLIWGEPGIGKSRLVATFQEAIKPDPQSCMSLF